MLEQPPVVGHIYLVTNSVTGKKYVGLSKQIKKRWGEHLSAARTGSPYPLHRAIRKYGPEKFEVVCLETIRTSREDLEAAEKHHISVQECKAPQGYNLTSGGEGVDFSVPGVRERMIEGARRRSATPEWKKSVAEAAVRRANDSEVQARLTEGCRERSASTEWKQKNLEACRRNAANPKWKEALLKGAQRRSEDPVWVEANKENLAKAWAASSAKAAARDAHLPVEEQFRRAEARKVRNARIKRRQERLKATHNEESSHV
jgi:group I intron endonuclease